MYCSIETEAVEPTHLRSIHPDQLCPGMMMTETPKIEVLTQIFSGTGDVFVIFTWTLFSAVAQPHRTRIIKTTKHFSID
jgi:hypothetical protein